MLKKSLLCTLLCALLGASICQAEVSLPDELKEIPLVTGSRIMQAMSLEQGAMAVIEVESTLSEVKEFYKQAFTGQGWKKLMEAEQEDSGVLQFMKDGAMISVSLTKGEGKIVYSLHLNRQ